MSSFHFFKDSEMLLGNWAFWLWNVVLIFLIIIGHSYNTVIMFGKRDVVIIVSQNANTNVFIVKISGCKPKVKGCNLQCVELFQE